ncbi:MAG: hypothetical protein E7509_03225 [Ruminococcus sp.]|nr:hypothetical protein [Ruminococcus sp.]
MLNLKDKILSYRQYYKISIVYSIVSCIIWAVWGIIDLIIMNDNNNLFTNIIVYGFLFVSVFVTLEIYMIASGMRDKEDELYKENVAKTNSSFLWFLFFTGFIIFIFASILTGITDKITIPIHQGFIGALIYMLYAVYNGIALHYESHTDNTEEE